jgi:hypothetical protein
VVREKVMLFLRDHPSSRPPHPSLGGLKLCNPASRPRTLMNVLISLQLHVPSENEKVHGPRALKGRGSSIEPFSSR